MVKSLLIVSAMFLAVVASVTAAPTPKKREYKRITFVLVHIIYKLVLILTRRYF